MDSDHRQVPDQAHHHYHHHYHYDQPPPPSRPRTVRIFTKADPDFCLSARDGAVVLAPANPKDYNQHWIKNSMYGKYVKDKAGYPSFALVNEATGQALQSNGLGQPVGLVEFDSDFLDRYLMWTEGMWRAEGYRSIRVADNICLNLDAFGGNKKVYDGTITKLCEWHEGKNQVWKMVLW